MVARHGHHALDKKKDYRFSSEKPGLHPRYQVGREENKIILRYKIHLARGGLIGFSFQVYLYLHVWKVQHRDGIKVFD